MLSLFLHLHLWALACRVVVVFLNVIYVAAYDFEMSLVVCMFVHRKGILKRVEWL